MYFSPRTRDYYAQEFIASYRGILILLIQQHLEFEVVTPRTLNDFQGNSLILPDVRVLNDEEKAWLRNYAGSGKTLVITGEDTTGLGPMANVVRFPDRPGRDYYEALQRNFSGTTPMREKEFLAGIKAGDAVQVQASPLLATSIARVEDAPHVFFANFAGLKGGVNPVQTPQTGVEVTISKAAGGHGFFLPFLGVVRPVEGRANGGGMTFQLPAIEKGAVFWYEPAGYKAQIQSPAN